MSFGAQPHKVHFVVDAEASERRNWRAVADDDAVELLVDAQRWHRGARAFIVDDRAVGCHELDRRFGLCNPLARGHVVFSKQMIARA